MWSKVAKPDLNLSERADSDPFNVSPYPQHLFQESLYNIESQKIQKMREENTFFYS